MSIQYPQTGGAIDDSAPSTQKTFSSSKIEQLLADLTLATGGGVVYMQESEPVGAPQGAIWFNPTTRQMRFFDNAFVSVTTDGGYF